MTIYKCTSCQFESSVPMSQCPRCANFNSFTAIIPPLAPGETAPAPYRPPGAAEPVTGEREGFPDEEETTVEGEP